MLENLDYPGRKSGRTPEEFGAGEFHRARDFPGRKRQVADRTPNARKLAERQRLQNPPRQKRNCDAHVHDRWQGQLSVQRNMVAATRPA